MPPNQLQDMNRHEWSWQRIDKFEGVRPRLVDALLGGYTGLRCEETCGPFYTSSLIAPYRGDCVNCFTSSTKAADISGLRKAAEQDVAEIGVHWNPGCADMLRPSVNGSVSLGEIDAFRVFLFADAAGNDNSCAAGCPNFNRPLCKAGVCIQPSCADAVPFCNNVSRAGQFARMFCSATCGCADVTSSLVLMAAKDGCPRACEAKRKTQLEQLPCADAGPGDPKLAAFTDQLLSTEFIGSMRGSIFSQMYSNFLVSGCDYVYDLEGNAGIRAMLVPHPCIPYPGISDGLGSFIRLFEHFCPGMHARMLHTRIHMRTCMHMQWPVAARRYLMVLFVAHRLARCARTTHPRSAPLTE